MSPRPMKPNEAIILALFLVAGFGIFLAWALTKCCRRAVDAEVHEMIVQRKRDVEAQPLNK